MHDHSHSHGHHHDHNHHHDHGHHHEHTHRPSSQVLLSSDGYEDMEIPDWKQRALAMGHVGDGDTYLHPPFGQAWDAQVSLSVPPTTATDSSSTIVESSRVKKSPSFHAHFDCFSGAAGDMMLAACLDASPHPGPLLHRIIQDIRLGIPQIAHEFDVQMEKVWRGYGGICGTQVMVYSTYHHQAAPVPIADSTSQNHPVNLETTSRKGGGPLRNLPEIKHLLTSASPKYIPKVVRDQAIKTFTELAIAESYTHGSSSVDTVHFHEVGAIDSIVDIVGTLLALHHLNIHSFSCSRLPMGEGMVWTDHGQLPVPAFATLRLMLGMKTCKGPGGDKMTGELVTPTAAALLRVLTGVAAQSEQGKNTTRPPLFTPRFVGIGAGTKDFPDHANILRIIIGDEVVDPSSPSAKAMNPLPPKESSKNCTESEEMLKSTPDMNISPESMNLPPSQESEKHCTESELIIKSPPPDVRISPESSSNSPYRIDLLTLLEANIDDATPEVLAYAVEVLLSKGAVDVWIQPIVMKKGRSAHMLSVLLSTTDEDTISTFIQLIFRHTTTIGIRIQRNMERAALHRRVIQVLTPYCSEDENGLVDVKICALGDEIMSMKPEFDHCKRIAQRFGISLESVSASAKGMATQMIRDSTAMDELIIR